MAVKYFVRYFDIIGVEHKLNIYDDNYEDEPIQVDGKINVTYSDTDDNLEAIRGRGLSVDLEANTDLTFSNLWSEDEKTFKVEYYLNNEIDFVGWLNPDGFYEDWVNTNWIVSFDCIDGLGYLSDLSFVDSNGFPFSGKMSYIKIISNALLRIGLSRDINTSIDIRYVGLDDELDVLANVYANMSRYKRDDENTIMSCEEVIRDVLEPFGAVLTSFKDAWYIYKPNQLYINQTATFYKYNYQGEQYGAPIQTPTKDLLLAVTIGNHSNGFYPHHCSGNQKIRNNSSIGAFRINYKYGVVSSYINNPELYTYDGLTIEDWNILGRSEIDPLVVGGSGIRMKLQPSNEVKKEILISKGVKIVSGASVDFNLDLGIYGAFGSNLKVESTPITLYFRIIFSPSPNLSAPFTPYYLDKNMTSWNTSSKEIPYAWGGHNDRVFSLKTSNIPDGFDDGYIFFEVLSAQYTYLFPQFGNTRIFYNKIDIKPSTTGDESNLKGEFHTVERTSRPSAKVEDVKEVATGDNPSDTYLGTLYKNDTVTPTELWKRKGFDESKPLLQIMGEETLRLNQKPTRVFAGDVYGYFPYFSVIIIDDLEGVFLPIKYNYDTVNNIISTELKQIYGEEVEDINYEKTYDYGNTVKPTIRG